MCHEYVRENRQKSFLNQILTHSDHIAASSERANEHRSRACVCPDSDSDSVPTGRAPLLITTPESDSGGAKVPGNVLNYPE